MYLYFHVKINIVNIREITIFTQLVIQHILFTKKIMFQRKKSLLRKLKLVCIYMFNFFIRIKKRQWDRWNNHSRKHFLAVLSFRKSTKIQSYIHKNNIISIHIINWSCCNLFSREIRTYYVYVVCKNNLQRRELCFEFIVTFWNWMKKYDFCFKGGYTSCN